MPVFNSPKHGSRFWVIRNRVEPAPGRDMSAVPPKTDIACAMKLLIMHGERARDETLAGRFNLR